MQDLSQQQSAFKPHAGTFFNNQAYHRLGRAMLVAACVPYVVWVLMRLPASSTPETQAQQLVKATQIVDQVAQSILIADRILRCLAAQECR